jgi:hypothetical protein
MDGSPLARRACPLHDDFSMRHLHRAFWAQFLFVVLACGRTKPLTSPDATGSAVAGTSGGAGAAGAAGTNGVAGASTAAGTTGTGSATGGAGTMGAGGIGGLCEDGRNAYATFRDKVIAEKGSTSCVVDTDCTILYQGHSVCEPSCRLIAQSSAGAQRVYQDMSSFPVHEECGSCEIRSWPLCPSRTVSCVAHVCALDAPPQVGTGQQGANCQRESDCASGFVCGYAISDGCAAHGVCVPRLPQDGGPFCGAQRVFCGCNGVTDTVGGCAYAGNYAPAPVLHDWPCESDGGVDGAASCAGWGALCGAATCCPGLGCSGLWLGIHPGTCVPL